MPQVAAEHYTFGRYDQRHRWLAYWYQLQTIARTGARSVLEIGRGSGVVSDYLRRRGIHVVTLDIDPALRPDVVGDVRHVGALFRPRSFDTVCAFQVLEHLPFADFAPTLAQMAQVARRHVIISLPHWGYAVHVRLWLKRYHFVFGRKITRPYTWRFDGQHHWEMGTRGHSLRRVVETVAHVLDIERHYFCPDYPYHYFFECRVKRAPDGALDKCCSFQTAPA